MPRHDYLRRKGAGEKVEKRCHTYLTTVNAAAGDRRFDEVGAGGDSRPSLPLPSVEDRDGSRSDVLADPPQPGEHSGTLPVIGVKE